MLKWYTHIKLKSREWSRPVVINIKFTFVTFQDGCVSHHELNPIAKKLSRQLTIHIYLIYKKELLQKEKFRLNRLSLQMINEKSHQNARHFDIYFRNHFQVLFLNKICNLGGLSWNFSFQNNSTSKQIYNRDYSPTKKDLIKKIYYIMYDNLHLW